jgi:hypothetical protein
MWQDKPLKSLACNKIDRRRVNGYTDVLQDEADFRYLYQATGLRAKCLLDVDSQQAKLLGSEVKSIPVFPMMPRGARKY